MTSGRYFVRFVVIEDQTQRRSICTALNQWMVSAAEKATGIGSHFASSLELTPATEYVPQPDDRQQCALCSRRQASQDTACGDGTPRQPALSQVEASREAKRAGPRTEPGFSVRILNGPAARLRSRHQHSLSLPIPLRFLTGGFWVAQPFRAAINRSLERDFGKRAVLSAAGNGFGKHDFACRNPQRDECVL